MQELGSPQEDCTN